MAGPIDVYEAKKHLSSLLDRAASGEEITIAKAGTPLARLVPLDPPRSARIGADDFDAPLPPDVF
jgi:prevent-host-death family protein